MITQVGHLGGGMHGVSRSAVFELLRAALEPTSERRGAMWAGPWAQQAPPLSRADFVSACTALEAILASGSLASGSLCRPQPSAATATMRVQPLSASQGPTAGGEFASFPPTDEQPTWTASAPPPPPPAPSGAAPSGAAPAPPFSEEEARQYRRLFDEMNGGERVTRAMVATTMARASLPPDEVDIIWALCDLDADGALDLEELTIALHLAASRYKGGALPESLPREWLSPQKAALLLLEGPACATAGGAHAGAAHAEADDAEADDAEDDLQSSDAPRKKGWLRRSSKARSSKAK